MKLGVIDYGAGNLRSVLNTFEAAGPRTVTLFDKSVRKPRFRTTATNIIRIITITILRIDSPNNFLITKPFMRRNHILEHSNLLFEQFIFLRILFFPRNEWKRYFINSSLCFRSFKIEQFISGSFSSC